MKTAKVFKDREGQAVRLPAEFEIPGEDVYIQQQGDAIILLPRAKSWQPLLDSLHEFDKDLNLERNQPQEQQKREKLLR